MRLIELADAALARAGQLRRAIEDTGRGLTWTAVEAAIASAGEGTAFEPPSQFWSRIGKARGATWQDRGGTLRTRSHPCGSLRGESAVQRSLIRLIRPIRGTETMRE